MMQLSEMEHDDIVRRGKIDNELTDEDIQKHLAQCDFLITTSKSERVIKDAKETRKVIENFQLQRNAKFN